ncbi:hypothetical protein PT250_00645 [Erysipelothrix rhusiopathiae]|uniref:DUF2975 domain-containing protein n=1 Tax=Erysipelothrix amsterdamensis TaxID=2929157 RepID=A0AAU9VFL6_9FIRM|nr:hypothetical protein [Erysipelothrix rhusiopathiae]CAH2761239.1 Uncharacterised protein [Erysipelothrix sp. A18Y020d]MDE8256193.1 hypothetical protein [Erysipelothrix rhusiopathiae]MDE8339367.1 hypothetical protein [Erysipelothrix rhusiopathiae]MDE8340621.1 hypothetical protein [Erysipelothrix rhusiopathiae]RNM29546.1 hypothetical protein EF876_04885 [Erysipelothrix rhusiopathiae]
MRNMIEEYRLKTNGNLGNIIYKWGPVILLVGAVILLVLTQMTFGNIFNAMTHVERFAGNVIKTKVMVSILMVVSICVGLLMIWDMIAFKEKRGEVNRLYSLIGTVFFFLTLVNINKITKLTNLIEIVEPTQSVYRIIAWGVIAVLGLVLGLIHAHKQNTRIVMEREVTYHA